jgi:hypothetical protein
MVKKIIITIFVFSTVIALNYNYEIKTSKPTLKEKCKNNKQCYKTTILNNFKEENLEKLIREKLEKIN